MPAEMEGWIVMKEMDSKDFLIVNVCEQNSDSRHMHLVLPDVNEVAGMHLRPKLSPYFSSYCLCELVTIYYVNPLARLLQKYCVLLILDSMQSLNHIFRVSFWTCSLFDLFAAASGVSVCFKIMSQLYYYQKLFCGLAVLWPHVSLYLLLILITFSFTNVKATIFNSFSWNLCLSNKKIFKSGNFLLSQMINSQLYLFWMKLQPHLNHNIHSHTASFDML